MKSGLYSHLKVGLALGTGALLALLLCAQCVRTYLYTDAVLVPQRAQQDAERAAAALSSAARSAGVNDPRALGAVIGHALESASDHVLSMRVLNADGTVVAHGGSVKTGIVSALPADWHDKFERHETIGSLVNTAAGKAFVTILPFRMPHLSPGVRTHAPDNNHRPDAYVVELAMSVKAVTGEFEGLRKNLFLGMTASLTLLIALAVIGLRMPQYLRGKHLEGELQLAKLVQRDLQPKPHSVSGGVTFAAASVAADHVGGDFYDIFEAAPGKTAIVLGDVSGKGVSAALLVSVLQGAIRSSNAAGHEAACERINHMLCELTANSRFATLFWAVYDRNSGTLRYVNAGHAAPMLIHGAQNRVERLDQGGAVLGLLPEARYTAASVKIGNADTLVLYSDGVNEAANAGEEEFGEDRLQIMLTRPGEASPEELCNSVMSEVAAFASAGPAPDDRTLMVVRFQRPETVAQRRDVVAMPVEAVA